MKSILISFVFLSACILSNAASVNVYDKYLKLGWGIYVDSELAESKPEAIGKALLKVKKSLSLIEKKMPKPFLDYAKRDGLKIFITSSKKAKDEKGMFFLPKNNSLWTRNFERIMDNSIIITDKSIFLLDSFNFSYYLIHELAHYYHFNILGYSNQLIWKKYYTAREDFNYKGTYAMNNHTEFFAELSAKFFMMEKDLIELDEDGADLMRHLWGGGTFKSEISVLSKGLANMPDWDALEKTKEEHIKRIFSSANNEKKN